MHTVRIPFTFSVVETEILRLGNCILTAVSRRILQSRSSETHNVTFDMTRSLDPFRFVLIAVSGWMNQQQLGADQLPVGREPSSSRATRRKAITLQR